MIEVMAEYGLLLLRISIGVVFVWFGLLKVIGATPVANLVAVVIPWISASISVPLVGIFEVVLGLALLTGLGLRVTLLLLWVHLTGTFLVLLIRPDLAFQNGNPLLLTADGEFIVKNLVLISGGIAIGSTARHTQSKFPPSTQSQELSSLRV
jgi:uncharacterized membrane protein YphA (DoxX/SURF4 family)